MLRDLKAQKRDLKRSHHRLGTEQLFKVSNISRLVECQKMGPVIKKVVRV